MTGSDVAPTPDPDPASGPPARGLSRRRLLAGGAGAAGLAVGAVAGAGSARALDSDGAPSAPVAGPDTVDLATSYPFYATAAGGHQAGVETVPQRYCVFMTFDAVTPLASDLEVLFARWSAAIAQMCAGLPVGSVQPDRAGAVAQDTGEALDLAASSLTVTLGLGPGLFDDRFGLARKRPKLLRELPDLPSDQLQAGLTGGDLSLQACADDPQVAFHAVRDLARIGRGVVNTRWVVLGFGRASAGQGQATPRNLLGFKDGTRNLKDAAGIEEYVWLGDDSVADGEQAWMRGGTYQVARKIRMDIEIWDSDDVTDQQRIFGRTKTDGAPLSGTLEGDTPDFTATGSDGSPVIDPKSHIALAARENNGGVQILRRGYNFTDGINDVGQLDAGLLFIAFMNDPDHFVRLQTKLGASDRLNEYIAHIGSAVFAVPPAPVPGSFLAKALFS